MCFRMTEVRRLARPTTIAILDTTPALAREIKT
jgi:hypothetical protein